MTNAHSRPPAKAKDDKEHLEFIAGAVFCAIALIILFILDGVTGSKVATCNSGIGQLGQAFSQSAQNKCQGIGLVHSGLEAFTFLAGLGVVVFLLGFVTMRPGSRIMQNSAKAKATNGAASPPTKPTAPPQA